MPAPAALSEHRPAPPAAFPPTPQQQRETAEQQAFQRDREHAERRRQLRGLLILALIVLAVSIARAGLGRVFPPAWWRLW